MSELIKGETWFGDKISFKVKMIEEISVEASTFVLSTSVYCPNQEEKFS